MNKCLKAITAIFVCAFASSCQKDFENNPVPVIPPIITPPIITPHDSVTRLSKLVFFDFRVSLTDTSGYAEYIYDSLQRVTAINYYGNDNGSPLLSEVYTYYYTGRDSLAYKMTDKDLDPVYGYSDTTFYFYDNLQRLIKDSVVFSSGIEVNEYEYSATKITGLQRLVYSADPLNTIVNTDTGFIGNTGDVIKTNSLTLTTDNYITSFTYDDKPNPFYQLNIRSTYNPIPGFNFFLEDFYNQKNNAVLVTDENQLFPGEIESNIFTYTYNSMGFPASVDVTYSFGQTDDYRIVFVYKKI